MRQALQRRAYAIEPGAIAEERICEWPGCLAAGGHRAPRSRDRLREYRWFCLDHVRVYNAGWNYYAGMSEAEIEAEIRRDTVWQRPTWPLHGAGSRRRPEIRIDDPLGIFGEPSPEEEAARHPRLDPAHAKAFAVFGLEPPATLERVRAAYRALVKKHHPDANGGDKVAEERLKSITAAYATLKNGYFA